MFRDHVNWKKDAKEIPPPPPPPDGRIQGGGGKVTAAPSPQFVGDSSPPAWEKE